MEWIKNPFPVLLMCPITLLLLALVGNDSRWTLILTGLLFISLAPWDDLTKWERHACSAVMDLEAAEAKTAEIVKERDALSLCYLNKCDELQSAEKSSDFYRAWKVKLESELQSAQQTIRDLTEKEQFLSNQLINLQADYDKLKSSPLK